MGYYAANGNTISPVTTQVGAQQVLNNLHYTAQMYPVPILGLVTGSTGTAVGNAAILQAIATNTTGPTRYVLPSGAIYVNGPITGWCTGGSLEGSGAYGDYGKGNSELIWTNSNSDGLIVTGGYTTQSNTCYTPTYFHDFQMYVSGNNSTGIGVHYCVFDNTQACNATLGHGGTGATIDRVEIGGFAQSIFADSMDSLHLHQDVVYAATTSTGSLVKIDGEGVNSSLIETLGGACTIRGGSTVYANALLEIDYGVGNTVIMGETSTCPNIFLLGNGTEGAEAKVFFADQEGVTNSFATTNANSIGDYTFLDSQGCSSNLTASAFQGAGQWTVHSTAACSGGTPLATPVAGTASPSTASGSLAAGTYSYMVAATNVANPASNVTAAWASATAPSTVEPCVLGATGTCTVNWTAVANATGYCIEGSTAGGSPLKGTCVNGQATNSFPDTGGNTWSGNPDYNNHTAAPFSTSTSSTAGAVVCTQPSLLSTYFPGMGSMQQNAYGEQVYCNGLQNVSDNQIPVAREYNRGALFGVTGRSSIANDDLVYSRRMSNGTYHDSYLASGADYGNSLGALGLTGTGALVEANAPTINNPVLNGICTGTGCSSTAPVIQSYGTGLIEVLAPSGNSYTAQNTILTACTGVSQAWNVVNTATATIKFTSAGTLGDCSGFTDGGTTRTNGQPLAVTGVAFTTTTDYSSNSRIWLGYFPAVCSVATVVASDAPACATGYAAMRLSTTASDSTWECITFDGTTQTITAMGAPTTSFQPVKLNVGASSVSCTVGTTTVTNTTHLPGTSSATAWYWMGANTITSGSIANHIIFSPLVATYQNTSVVN
ncbi:MAG: hypothetical protein WCF54_08145 [Terracidiphilus sp.]